MTLMLVFQIAGTLFSSFQMLGNNFFRYIAKFSPWRVTLHGLKFRSPSPIRQLELEQEVHNRRAFLAELYCEAYNQNLTILYLLLVHPLTYRGPGWFFSCQLSYQAKIEALLQAILSSAGHLVQMISFVLSAIVPVFHFLYLDVLLYFCQLLQILLCFSPFLFALGFSSSQFCFWWGCLSNCSTFST